MAKKQEKADVVVLPADNLEEEISMHVEIVPLDKKIKNEIAQFNVAKAGITNLKKKFSKIPAIEGIEDKKGYKETDEARKALKKVRANIENKRKELKADYIAIGKGIEAYANELKALVDDGNGGLLALTSETGRIDQLFELEKIRLEEEAEAKVNKRLEDLEAAGLAYDGRFYSLRDITIDIVSLKEFTDEQFDGLLARVVEVKAEVVEEERLAAEKEEQRLAHIEEQRVENERVAAEQEKRQKEIDDKEKAFQLKVVNLRKKELQGLKMVFDAVDNAFKFSTKSGEVEVTIEVVEELSDEDFQDRFNAVKKRINEIEVAEADRIKEESEKAERQASFDKMVEARKNIIIGMGYDFDAMDSGFTLVNSFTPALRFIDLDEIVNVPQENWVTYTKDLKTSSVEWIQNQKIEREKSDEAEEELRQLSLSDEQAVAEYMENLQKALNKKIGLKVVTTIKALEVFKEIVGKASHDLYEKIK